MKTRVKYLVIGWSILCIGIIIISFEIMKKDYIQEDFDIFLPLKVPLKTEVSNLEIIAESLYHNDEDFLSKEKFIERVKVAKSIELRSNFKVKNKSIYLYLPFYTFIVWAFPILMFALLGNLFEKN